VKFIGDQPGFFRSGSQPPLGYGDVVFRENFYGSLINYRGNYTINEWWVAHRA
jgi:hypothetical protein